MIFSNSQCFETQIVICTLREIYYILNEIQVYTFNSMIKDLKAHDGKNTEAELEIELDKDISAGSGNTRSEICKLRCYAMSGIAKD